MTGSAAVVVIGHWQTAPRLPVVVLLLGSLSWAIGNVITRHAKAAGGLSLVVWSGLVVPLAGVRPVPHHRQPAGRVRRASPTSRGRRSSARSYTAVLASLVGYGIWNHLLARYPTSAVVPFALLVPVVGIVAAWIVVNEQPPSLSELIGGAVMLAGLAIASLVTNRRREPDLDVASIQ